MATKNRSDTNTASTSAKVSPTKPTSAASAVPAETPFSIGDRVRLKSGGADMKVVGIVNGKYKCSYDGQTIVLKPKYLRKLDT